MSQSEDMEAVNVYMRTTPLVTPEAFQIKDSFIRWYDGLSWWDKSMNSDTWDNARTRRNQLNIANQPTQAKKDEIREVLARAVDQSPNFDKQTGRVGSQVKTPTVAPTPSTMPKPGQPTAPIAQGSAPVALTRVLSQGVTDGGRGDVKAWQTFLGIIPPTGNFATTTVEKTKAFQRSKGLTADGKVGQITWTAAFPAGAKPATSGDAFAPSPPPPKPADVFAPTPAPKPNASKPSGGSSAPKPTTVKEKTKAVAAQTKDTAKKAVVAVKQAGVFDVGTWPLWAKVTGILTIVGGAIAAATGHATPRKFGTHR
jgi:hypothetical protein